MLVTRTGKIKIYFVKTKPNKKIKRELSVNQNINMYL